MKTYNMLFLAPEGGEGGSGGDIGGGETSRGIDAFVEPTVKQTTGEPEPPAPRTPSVPKPSVPKPGPVGDAPVPAQPEPEPTPSAPPPFDPTKFAHEFGSVIGETLRPALERRDEPQMSPEEARRMLNVWEPDDAWFTQYDNLEQRRDAIGTMRDALIRQADTLAQMRMREALNTLREEFMPHIQASQAMITQQRDDRFLGMYPQLGNDALRPLIKAVADDMANQGKRFNSEREAFTALASGVEAVMKVNNPEFKLEPVGNDGQQQGRTTGKIPVTTPGSGGGTGRREGTAKAEKPRGIAVFDKVAG